MIIIKVHLPATCPLKNGKLMALALLRFPPILYFFAWIKWHGGACLGLLARSVASFRKRVFVNILNFQLGSAASGASSCRATSSSSSIRSAFKLSVACFSSEKNWKKFSSQALNSRLDLFRQFLSFSCSLAKRVVCQTKFSSLLSLSR